MNILAGNYAPWHTEDVVNHLKVVQGAIPDDLNGTLYRNGPNPQFPNEAHHWFEGDGMIHAVHLQNGVAHYQNRWVRTNQFNLERDAGKSLRTSFSVSNEDHDLMTANTNVVWHANQLLALQETTAAIQINPENLHTLGINDFSKAIKSMSAHPRADYLTGELLCYDYQPFSKDIHFYCISPQGQVTHSKRITAPYCSFMHDFAITRHHVIFPVMPLTFSMERVQQGKPLLMWEEGLMAHFGIMPRDGTAGDVQWFEVDPFYTYHFMNAYEEAGRIILDGVKSNKATLMLDSSSGELVSAEDGAGYLTRWEFDLKTHQVKSRRLGEHIIEFPRFDSRYSGQSYRHGFCVSRLTFSAEGYDALLHYDLKTGQTTERDCGLNSRPSEPIFVPKSHNCAEGEGYLLSWVYDEAEDNSVLLILDAMHIDQDPIATLAMPHRIPHGFHGNWVPHHHYQA